VNQKCKIILSTYRGTEFELSCIFAKMDDKNYVEEIRIRCVPASVNESLSNIARSIGVTKNAFLKTELKKIIDSYPPEKRHFSDRD
jgi:hypothetical protein